MVAMTGKNCVAIASDRRFGVRQLTVSCDETKIFPVTDKLMLGMTGLQTDVLTVKNKLNFRTELYKLREERDISPHAFASSLSALLYEHRCVPMPAACWCSPRQRLTLPTHHHLPFHSPPAADLAHTSSARSLPA